MAHRFPPAVGLRIDDLIRQSEKRSSFGFKPLAAAAALAGLSLLPLDAAADWRGRCGDDHLNHAVSGSGCHRPFNEGLAAVIAGSAADDTPAWGYLDKSGAMAIAPAYTNAGPFQNGLAPVSQGNAWGYIDTKGRWVIEPRFANATGFNAQGTALVREGEYDALIDRTGQIIKTFALGVRVSGFHAGQTLAPIDVPTPPRLFDTATGKPVDLPEDVIELAAPLGDRSHFPARSLTARHESWWGMLHAGQGWLIPPQILRAESPPLQDGHVLAVRRKFGWVFMDQRCGLLSPDPYQRIELVTPGLWLAHPPTGQPTLLDGDLGHIHTLEKAQSNIHTREGWRYSAGTKSTVLVNPSGRVHVLLLHKGRVNINRGYAWVYGKPPAVATDQGVSAHAEKEFLYQIYDSHGRAMLDEATVAALRGYRLDVFDLKPDAELKDKDLPLALLEANDGSSPGLLTAAGTLVTNPDWYRIGTYKATLPLLVTTNDQRVGAIAPDGSWAVRPVYRDISRFTGSYTWAFKPGKIREDAVLIDARGKTVEIPAMVTEDESRVKGDLLHFRAMDENRQRRWGIWDIRKGALAFQPVYESIESIDDDWAMAQDKERWGVVDRAGQWVIAATHNSAHDFQYFGQGMISVAARDAAPQRGGRATPTYRLVDLRTGQSSESFIGTPNSLKDGRFLSKRADGSMVLLDSRGRAQYVSDGRPKEHAHFGNWFYTTYDKREGAIDARGNMQLPAIYDEFHPFFVQPEGLARVFLRGQHRLIDQTGKTLLGHLHDATPLASMQRIVLSDDAGSDVMLDLEGREIARIAGAYSVRTRDASEGVVPYSDKGRNWGFINAAGERVVGPHFDDLGPMKSGLARARLMERTGALHGYIDLTGRYAIAPAFEHAGDFQEGRALVRRGEHVEFIDTKGKTIARFTHKCGVMVILDARGRQSWPPRKLTCQKNTATVSPSTPKAAAK
ncbi:WG repeat-containing protein [Achromobacter spanius]|nr:WG repeat-containing protein [Achromobacter spanius]